MDISWDDVRLFLAVAQTGSLTAASRRLQMTQPTISRRLSELEAQLGEPLFVRGVEGTTLTAYGERMLEPARRMAEWAAEVERTAEHVERTPAGVVKITASPGVSFDFLAPFSVYLKKKLPDIQLEVISTVQYLDLTRREADLALRTQKSTQRDHVNLVGLEFDVAAFASESYIAKLKSPYTFTDIHWIAWAPPFTNLPPGPQLSERIAGFRPVFTSDDFLVQLRAAEAGIGAIFMGCVTHRLAMPTTLRPLNLELGPLRGQLHLVAARSALDIPRVRAVSDLLVSELQKAKVYSVKKA